MFVISIVLCSIVLFSFSCAGNPTVTKPKNPLIGKWEVIDSNSRELLGMLYVGVELEFLEDGTLIVGGGAASSYKILDQTRVELGDSSAGNMVFEFSISGDELTLTSGGLFLKLKRVK